MHGRLFHESDPMLVGVGPSLKERRDPDPPTPADENSEASVSQHGSIREREVAMYPTPRSVTKIKRYRPPRREHYAGPIGVEKRVLPKVSPDIL